MFDKNEAIRAYSGFGGNVVRTAELHRYCQSSRFSGDVEALAASIRQVQDEVFQTIWRRSEHCLLTDDDVRDLTLEHLRRQHQDINDVAAEAILQWVRWMSWHEGCLTPVESTQTRKNLVASLASIVRKLTRKQTEYR